jgi:quercetin dioxygenase-like cupin family protein
MKYEEVLNPVTGKYYLCKTLAAAADGDKIDIFNLTYPKGYTTVWHTHNMSHGIYVLKGTLKTHEGLYGPGSFIWFPEGLVMQHGATDEEDCEMLFICTKEFNINWAGKNYDISYKK